MARARTKFKPFTPYTPPPPPAGSYDPSLDSQLGQVGRGLFDLGQTIGTQNTRDTTDYGTQRGQLLQQQQYGLADLTQSRDRNLSDLNTQWQQTLHDLATQRSQATDAHTRNIDMLHRAYAQLSSQQGQAARAAGVMNGGAVLQAAAKRQANQANDQAPIDTQFSQALAALNTAQQQGQQAYDTQAQRIAQDFQTGSDRLNASTDYGLGQLALQLAPPNASNPFGGRAFQDRLTQLTRAQRDAAAFGLDVQGQKAYEAAGSGWAPPGRGEKGGIQSNEFTDAQGNPYRVVVRGGMRYTVDPRGNILSTRRR